MLKILNPATKQLIAELPEDSADSVKAKVLAARAAQSAWSRTPFEARKGAIAKWKALVAEHKDRLARTLTAEMGKPLQQALNELNALPGRVDFFLSHAASVLEDEIVSSAGAGTEERVTWEPLGVIANISAWNYPYFVGSNVFVPALLTGNAVLYKPSELASLTGEHIGRLLREAGVPADVFQTLIGGRELGAALLELQLDGVFFTGSYATGRKIAEKIAPRMIRLQLELGGKDPAYVTDEVDVAAAAAAVADGAFYNTGQSCCAVERIYVHEKVYAPFVEALVAEVQKFKLGEPTAADTYIGPLCRGEAAVHDLSEQVLDAERQGGRVLTGGKRAARPGAYFEPTVIVDVKPGMRVMRDESFGPI